MTLRSLLLLVSLFGYAATGIAFELLLAGFAGYVLGESLLLLSVVIGLYLSSMGLGAHLSRRLADPPVDAFVLVGAALAIVGAASPAFILLAATLRAHVELTVGLCTIACGTLTGLVLPLGARLFVSGGALPKAVAAVLALDYLGALAGSLMLPAFVLPGGGYLRGAALLGAVTLFASLGAYMHGRAGARHRALAGGVLLFATLPVGGALLHGDRLLDWAWSRITGERILRREHSAYQEILLTRGSAGLGLRLNGRIQFQQQWERRYHEALVHPALSLAPARRDVLLLGGGDGLPVREILRYGDVQRVTLVDLDPRMIALSREEPRLVALNEGALSDERVRVIHEDAFRFVAQSLDTFDVIIVDLPVPVSLSLSKLYSVEFYRNVAARLRPKGLIAVQSTAFDASRARVLACIGRSLRAAGLRARPYLLEKMGYHMAGRQPFDPQTLALRAPTRFLTSETARGLFALPADITALDAEVNTVESHALLGYMR